MNKLSKEKKDKLLLTGIGCLGVIAVLYFLVITDQKAEIAQLDSRIDALQAKRNFSEKQGKRTGEVQASLEEARKILIQKQTEMPKPEEDKLWFLRIMEEMRPRYGLELEEVKNPLPYEPGVLPNFPFRGVSLSVSMVGNYTDFGRFLADFENRFPYMRVELMSISPDRAPAAAVRGIETIPSVSASRDSGNLRFNFRVIALIKSQV